MRRVARAGAGVTAADGDPATGQADVPVSLAFQEPTVAGHKDIVDGLERRPTPTSRSSTSRAAGTRCTTSCVTQFAGGTAPDIIHYESAAIDEFAKQGYLADLAALPQPRTSSGACRGHLGHRHDADGEIARADAARSPSRLRQPKLLEAAGIEVPDRRDAGVGRVPGNAAELTTDGDATASAGGCKSPTATVMNLASASTATSSSTEGERSRSRSATPRCEVPRAHPRHGLRRPVARPGDADAERRATCCPASSPASTR